MEDLAITHKSVATWILHKDFKALQDLAAKNNVSIASYMRGIIVDAIQDELYRPVGVVVNIDSTISLNK